MWVMNEFAVVAIGYNRPDCMLRLLNSLNQTDYCGDTVPLIISIDNSGNDAVTRIAEKFEWKYGEKFIKTYPERLGLKKHILACGQFTQQYQHIAVFEDDLYVSESFYRFAKQAVEFYKDDDRIAGIALYSHLWNVGCNRPFSPINDQYDVYFMQYACSWGQVWSKDKWNKFISWYKKNDEEILSSPYIPGNVVSWPDNSWLKYHIKYCIETNKYFVYPRASLSTNFSSKGEHNIKNRNGYQVPLQFEFKREYVLPYFDESVVKYDAFFEFINISNYLGLKKADVCVDLYGMKNNNLNKRYWLTTESADYKIIQSYDMSMRPQEMNVIHKIYGDKIRLFNTSIKKVNKRLKKLEEEVLKVEYDIKNISYRSLLKYILVTTFKKILYKLTHGGKEAW